MCCLSSVANSQGNLLKSRQLNESKSLFRMRQAQMAHIREMRQNTAHTLENSLFDSMSMWRTERNKSLHVKNQDKRQWESEKEKKTGVHTHQHHRHYNNNNNNNNAQFKLADNLPSIFQIKAFPDFFLCVLIRTECSLFDFWLRAFIFTKPHLMSEGLLVWFEFCSHNVFFSVLMLQRITIHSS